MQSSDEELISTDKMEEFVAKLSATISSTMSGNTVAEEHSNLRDNTTVDSTDHPINWSSVGTQTRDISEDTSDKTMDDTIDDKPLKSDSNESPIGTTDPTNELAVDDSNHKTSDPNAHSDKSLNTSSDQLAVIGSAIQTPINQITRDSSPDTSDSNDNKGEDMTDITNQGTSDLPQVDETIGLITHELPLDVAQDMDSKQTTRCVETLNILKGRSIEPPISQTGVKSVVSQSMSAKRAPRKQTLLVRTELPAHNDQCLLSPLPTPGTANHIQEYTVLKPLKVVSKQSPNIIHLMEATEPIVTTNVSTPQSMPTIDEEFKCPIGDCAHVFDNFGQYTRHVIHCQRVCKECALVLTDAEELEQHQRLFRRRDVDYMCTDCHQLCLTERNMVLHNSWRHKRPYLMCDTCDYITDSEDRLETHAIYHEMGLIETPKAIYECFHTQCRQRYKRLSPFRRHLVRDHKINANSVKDSSDWVTADMNGGEEPIPAINESVKTEQTSLAAVAVDIVKPFETAPEVAETPIAAVVPAMTESTEAHVAVAADTPPTLKPMTPLKPKITTTITPIPIDSPPKASLSNQSLPERSLECTFTGCKQLFADFNALDTHWINKHGIYVRTTAKKPTPTARGQKRRLSDQTAQRLREEHLFYRTDIQYSCSDCRQLLLTEQNQVFHDHWLHGKPCLLCESCEFITTSANQVFHDHWLHGKPCLLCESCEFITTSAVKLTKHREYHQNGFVVFNKRSFECFECRMKCGTEEFLRYHLINRHQINAELIRLTPEDRVLDFNPIVFSLKISIKRNTFDLN
ncbi:unnamed protein product [Medioppia subpectinata]|uniref:C2H2-type domain-containing protein n=1 Tax=Medioppia subpectinata TaxID=1979941 RepID=A0A7R9Q259_9ACAR|nr:unnamed protein product [Medioppia subpectinata]CAG2109083.1 unnamed protein product [Medioppia subpectinata]